MRFKINFKAASAAHPVAPPSLSSPASSKPPSVLADEMERINVAVQKMGGFFIDELGRKHVPTTRSGFLFFMLRPTKGEHRSTIETHMNDLVYIFEQTLKPKVFTSLTLLVDQGPDWTAKSKVTFIFASRLFKRFRLATLTLSGFGPTWSKLNPIERKWAAASRFLTSAVLPATTPGFKVPPNKIPKNGLSESEHRDLIQSEENKLFDSSVTKLRRYFHDKPHDGLPIFAQGVASETEKYPWADFDQVSTFAKASKTKIRNDTKLSAIRGEYIWAIKHCTVMAHELHFLRCDNRCDHCRNIPETQASSFRRRRGGIPFSATLNT